MENDVFPLVSRAVEASPGKKGDALWQHTRRGKKSSLGRWSWLGSVVLFDGGEEEEDRKRVLDQRFLFLG